MRSPRHGASISRFRPWRRVTSWSPELTLLSDPTRRFRLGTNRHPTER